MKDARCGYCGPRIAEAFKGAVGIGSAVVRKTSHLGGHKYAANVVMYPSGHWWGYVKPKDIDRLLPLVNLGLPDAPFSPESLLDGPPAGLVDLWRGRMGLTKERQKELTPNSKAGTLRGDEGETPLTSPMASPSDPKKSKSSSSGTLSSLAAKLVKDKSKSKKSKGSKEKAVDAGEKEEQKEKKAESTESEAELEKEAEAASPPLKPVEAPLRLNVTSRGRVQVFPKEEGWANPANRLLVSIFVCLLAMFLFATWRQSGSAE
jgi:(2Fe-2S) ferredoxin